MCALIAKLNEDNTRLTMLVKQKNKNLKNLTSTKNFCNDQVLTIQDVKRIEKLYAGKK
tara:strand:- start:85 stop:258 length:174 start_codon:yes stop_codon:yes gene_type:complete